MCREHVAQVRDQSAKLESAGTGVVAIGTGGSRYARDFIAERGIPFPVLLDRDGEAAAIASVRQGIGMVTSPGSWLGAARALQNGYRQGRTGPRPTQQGASFVIERGGELLYAHLDAHPGDHAPMAEVLAAAGIR